MTQTNKHRRILVQLTGLGCLYGIANVLTGCANVSNTLSSNKPRPAASLAKSEKEYRTHAAKHLYSANGPQIYKGKLPPLLHAISVIRLNISADGDLVSIDWMRKPTHAPDVMAEIEKKIWAAEPFPAPVHLGALTYTETWLWHKSGLFQLDTLTEGQL
jgi:hypothetical protein